MTCQLCGEQRKLCRSHVIPEFFYPQLHDERHRLQQHDRDSASVRFAQKSNAEPLLCEECEVLLNERYEKRFKTAWYDNHALPRKPNFTQATITGLEYSSFKLCLLSILWRASVAKQPLFSHVDLGPKHGRAIRDMPLSGEPGPEELYPIAAQVLWLKDHVARSPVLQPVPRRYDHKRVYVFGFGGCVWYFLIGSDAVGMFRSLTIRRDGTLPIMWQDLAKLDLVRDFLREHMRAGGRVGS